MAFQQEIHLGLAADESARPAGRTALKRLPEADRPSTAHAPTGSPIPLSSCRPSRADGKITEQPARGLGDDDRIRLDQGLEASCKVRRVPDHRVLPHAFLAAEVADHHQAGGDSNADRERLSGARLEPSDSGNDIEPRPHGSLGIVLVRAGIAEIGEYSVPPEIRKKPSYDSVIRAQVAW